METCGTISVPNSKSSLWNNYLTILKVTVTLITKKLLLFLCEIAYGNNIAILINVTIY